LSAADALLARLVEIEGGSAWSESDFRTELASPASRVFLWPSSVAPEGFVLYRVGPMSDGEPSEGIQYKEAWVMNLAVQPRGQGQGRKLWAAFEAHLQNEEVGVVQIGLEVASRNAAALRLYATAGFRLVGVRKNYYKNSDDAQVHLKRL